MVGDALVLVAVTERPRQALPAVGWGRRSRRARGRC
jgi:hypothetical protein